jgi:Mg-chelatase subunit ChlD
MDAIPGVKVCTAAFPGGNSGWEASVVPLTRFGQSVRATTKHYSLGATGGTPLTEALYWAACQLLAQPEPRKIILVATDGDPNDPASTKFAIRRLEAEGIELLGLGIQHEGVRSLFGTHAVIQNLNELPKSVFGMLQSELVRKRA